MRLHVLFIYTLLFTTNASADTDQNGWVHPHDMSPVYDKEYFPYPDIELEAPESRQVSENCDQNESQSRAYLKRTINMILNAVHEDTIHENKYKGHLIFEIDMDKFARLHEFTNNRFDDLNEVDMILSEILKKPSHAYLKEYFLGWCYKGLKAISSRSGIFAICILSYVFVVYKMMRGYFNYWAILKFLFINVIIFDFVFVWIRLYQRAEIDKLAGSAKYINSPNYCNPKTMSSMDIMWSVLSSKDECKEYHHVTLTDIFWNVSPGDVLSEMLTKAITQPMKAMGPAIGQFIYGIYGSLPFGVNVVLLPVVLIFVMIMMSILLSFILNVPIKFNFFHLISFSFGDGGQPANGNVLTGRTVEQLLDMVKDNQTPRYLADDPTSAVNLMEAEANDVLSVQSPCVECNVAGKEQPSSKLLEIKDDEHVIVEKDGYESDVILCETEINKQDLRKRKREEGAGDM